MRVRERLKTKEKLFLVNIYFAFWSVQAKMLLKLIKKYIFSEGEVSFNLSHPALHIHIQSQTLLQNTNEVKIRRNTISI